MTGNLTDGMDIARVREIASQLATEAGKCGDVNQAGNTQATTLGENWLGADSEQFVQSWQDASKSLQAAQTSLEEYSKNATQQADQQEGASR